MAVDVAFLEGLNSTGTLFVIPVIVGKRPILYFAERVTEPTARVVPVPEPMAYYLLSRSPAPQPRSFITESTQRALKEGS